MVEEKNSTGDLSTVACVEWYGSSVISSHGCTKDEIVFNQSESLPISHKWVRSKQCRQEVTFCVMKMLLNIQYIANFPVKGCLFCGYTTGYVINSVGLREIFTSSQLHGCVSSVFTWSYFSIAVDSVVHDGRKRPQL